MVGGIFFGISFVFAQNAEPLPSIQKTCEYNWKSTSDPSLNKFLKITIDTYGRDSTAGVLECSNYCGAQYQKESGGGFALCSLDGQPVSVTESAPAQRSGAGYWSCVVRYPPEVVFDNTDKHEFCHDLKKPEFGISTTGGDVGKARAYCNDFCERGSRAAGSGDRVATFCVLLTEFSCFEYNQDVAPGASSGEPLENINQISAGARSLNQLGAITAEGLVGRVIQTAMGVMGTVALLMFIYGGILWMTARGNSDAAGKAIKIFMWSGLGVIVILTSYSIVNFVFEAFAP
jgi:hypothetical protein